jgi:hypothetical protein
VAVATWLVSVREVEFETAMAVSSNSTFEAAVSATEAGDVACWFASESDGVDDLADCKLYAAMEITATTTMSIFRRLCHERFFGGGGGWICIDFFPGASNPNNSLGLSTRTSKTQKRNSEIEYGQSGHMLWAKVLRYDCFMTNQAAHHLTDLSCTSSIHVNLSSERPFYTDEDRVLF